jgi:hypothetical protein
MTAPAHLAELRFRRAVEALWHLGPRPLAEFLDEIGAQHLIRTEIESTLRRYSRLNIDTVRAVGAERFPPTVWSVRPR